jgi:transcriptional regulator with XRE-family HTH domain
VSETAWRKLAADFARELTELRKDRGLSWDELAARSEVSRTYLRDLARGRGSGLPSDPVVRRIAGAFDVAPDHFRITRARAVLASPQVIDAVYTKLRKAAA